MMPLILSAVVAQRNISLTSNEALLYQLEDNLKTSNTVYANGYNAPDGADADADGNVNVKRVQVWFMVMARGHDTDSKGSRALVLLGEGRV